MKKIGRNDPCVCGSGKKFKKCCENKMISKRFMATRIESSAEMPDQKTLKMSSFFAQALAQTPKKPMPEVKSEKPEIGETAPVFTQEPEENSEQSFPQKETIC